MAKGNLTTRGRCNFCNAVIAWKSVTKTPEWPSGWQLCNAQRDENGALVKVMVKNGKGRTALRPTPGALHSCSAVLNGKVRGGKERPEGLKPPEPSSPYAVQYAPKPPETSSPPPPEPTERPEGSGPGPIPHYESRPVETESKAPVQHITYEPIDYGRIRTEMVKILDEYGVEPPPTIIKVEQAGQPTKVEGIAHPNLPRLIRLVAARIHTYLTGPAGTGKTFAAIQAAEALGLRVAVFTMPGIQSPARIFGFENAKGEYIPTVFASYFEHGGVLVADELDRMIPQVAASLNSSLENGRAVFGGRTVEAHKDFCLVATGNTDMRGATMDYTAGQPLDYATAARFAFVDWPNDLATETKLVKAIIGLRPAGRLLDFFERLRHAVSRAAIEKILCGPRESMRVAQDLKMGTSVETAMDSWVRRGLDSDAWDALIGDAGGLPIIELEELS
jgi:hypothetical protein